MLNQNNDRGKTTKAADQQLRQITPAYNRDGYRTFLTAPEWRNVNMDVEIAEFLGQNKRFL